MLGASRLDALPRSELNKLFAADEPQRARFAHRSDEAIFHFSRALLRNSVHSKGLELLVTHKVQVAVKA